ncbi:hypothetical protein ACFWVC_17530 [Streptomyces sp. NPDC058691]|uniref:hypothetical protein n=1 Tax=Streptomyces sp. NPDC058691 TaxID=3346601 RepID=UPI003646D8C7
MAPKRREPHHPFRSCPTDALLAGLRKAVSVALLAASLTTLSAVCGWQQSAMASASLAPIPRIPSPSVDVPANGVISTRRVYFTETTHGVPSVHTVLDNERDLYRLPGYFMASEPRIGEEITSRAARTDFSRFVLVAWSRTTGCDSTKDATLFRSGSRLVLGLDQTPMGRCLAANQVVAVFEVPRDRMPKEPRFAQEQNPRADPPGPGRTLALSPLDGDSRSSGGRRSAEVTTTRQLDAFLAGLPRKGADAVRRQLAGHPQRGGERRFAFILSSCRATGANLNIGRRELSAAPTGDEAVDCYRAHPYVAVLSIASHLVPAHAQLVG